MRNLGRNARFCAFGKEKMFVSSNRKSFFVRQSGNFVFVLLFWS